MRNTFKREEKLKKSKLITQLFAEGNSISVFPIKLIYLQVDHDSPYKIQAGVSAAKRNFNKAVDRNKIKRLIREVYRKNKNILYDFLNTNNINCIFSVIYISKKILPYKEFENKILLLLQKLIKENVENIK